MPQLFDIRNVTVGPRTLEAVVAVAPSAPLLTSEDPEATERVMALMPELAEHVCPGDSSPRFGEVVAFTELAHLLEHVSVELLARTNAAGDVTSGQTLEVGERTYQITLACPDDVLVAGALSSAAWIMQWAYSGGGDPRPDVEAIASGLVDLVASLDGASEATEEASGESAGDFEEPFVEKSVEDGAEFADAAAAVPPASAGEPSPELTPDSPVSSAAAPEEPAPDWDMNDVPRPHLVR